MPRRTGFTLIEVMVVVAILAILAMVAVAQFQKYLERSRNTATQALLHHLALAQMTLKTEPGGQDFLTVDDTVGIASIQRLGDFGFRPDRRVGFAAIPFDGEEYGAYVLFAAFCQQNAQVFVYNLIPRAGVRPYDPSAVYATILPATLEAYDWNGGSVTRVAVLTVDAANGVIVNVVP